MTASSSPDDIAGGDPDRALPLDLSDLVLPPDAVPRPTFDARAAVDDEGHARAPAAADEGAFEGSAEFADAIRRVLRHATERGARQLRWCDDDFAAWPLGDAEVVDLLVEWARPGGRELVMIAARYDAVQRLHPRFVRWRQDWAHAVTCLEPAERSEDPLPGLWLDSVDQVVRVFDREHWRGRVGADRVDRQVAIERLDAISQRATPAFAASTLGL
jgi:hypothetical protein